jgi:hypothetical protein
MQIPPLHFIGRKRSYAMLRTLSLAVLFCFVLYVGSTKPTKIKDPESINNGIAARMVASSDYIDRNTGYLKYIGTPDVDPGYSYPVND